MVNHLINFYSTYIQMDYSILHFDSDRVVTPTILFYQRPAHSLNLPAQEKCFPYLVDDKHK